MNVQLKSHSFIESISSRLIYTCIRLFLWTFLWQWNRGVVHGTLPNEALVLVPNHGSYLDWVILDILLRKKYRREVIFLAKAKVFKNPIWRAAARVSKPIIVDQGGRFKAVASAARFLRSSSLERPIICIFPEGTRSRSGEKSKIVSGGAAWLARKLHVPMVPVALCGFWEVWPPKNHLPSLKRVGLSVHFLPPINPGDAGDDHADTDSAVEKAYEVVSIQRALTTNPS